MCGGYSSNRNTNIDGLRLVLMYMIVVHHSIVHALGFEMIQKGLAIPAENNHLLFFS